MHRPSHPRRRPPAAAPRTFSGRTVTPTPAPTPVADVKTHTAATNAPAAPASPLPPRGAPATVPAHRAGALALGGRNLSAGDQGSTRRMTTRICTEAGVAGVAL